MENKNCEHCEYVTDTPLGSYCSLTHIGIGITECHYDAQKDYEEMCEDVIKGMR